MSEQLSLRSRLSALRHKGGYARIVKERLEAKGINVTERHIYLVVNGYKRRLSLEIELEVLQFVIEREKYEGELKSQRQALQAA